MSKRNSAIAKKVEHFMANLPSDYLWQYATTQDLINEWLALRHYSTNLGECLKARFAGGGGNPALRALQAGEIEQFDYDLVMAIVNWYESIFNLVQSGWEYIDQELSAVLEDYPSTELKMYLEILKDFADTKFQMAIKGYKISIQEEEKRVKLFCDAFNRGVSIRHENLTVLSASHREKLLLQKSPPEAKNFWLSMVMAILFSKQKQDNSIKNLCNDYLYKMKILNELYLAGYRAERGKNKPGRFQSRQFKNGELYLGVKGGYRKFT
jgi:hypothetical protein